MLEAHLFCSCLVSASLVHSGRLQGHISRRMYDFMINPGLPRRLRAVHQIIGDLDRLPEPGGALRKVAAPVLNMTGQLSLAQIRDS
jgi:hypothetical protein